MELNVVIDKNEDSLIIDTMNFDFLDTKVSLNFNNDGKGLIAFSEIINLLKRRIDIDRINFIIQPIDYNKLVVEIETDNFRQNFYCAKIFFIDTAIEISFCYNITGIISLTEIIIALKKIRNISNIQFVMNKSDLKGFELKNFLEHVI